jgi:hypothetical protein
MARIFNNCEFNSINEILEWYEMQNISNWSIFSGKEEHIKYVGSEDPEESLQILNIALNKIKNNQAVENTYTLRCNPKNPKIKEKPIIVFCLNTNVSSSNIIAGFNPGYATKNDIEEIKRMIEAQEIENEIDELKPEPQKNFLAGLLENEQVQTMVVSAITGLIGSFLVKKPVVTSLAGVDDLDSILKTLFSKGVKLEHLKKLADMPEDKISMLIQML